MSLTAPIVTLLLILAPTTVHGQVPDGEGPFTPHPEGTEAIQRLKSPYCPGLMLSVCPSPQAGELRDSIQMLAHDGMSADSLVEWMIANHGEEWRALPKKEGSGLWAWVLPPVALIVGVGIVAVALSRLRTRGIGREEAARLTDDERARLDGALEELEELEEPLF